MKVYNYSRIDRSYTTTTDARPNPRSGGFSCPAFATFDEIPPFVKGETIPVRDGADENWIIKKDNRGKKFYDKETGAEGVVRNIGEEAPDDSVDEKPSDELIKPKRQGNKWVETADTLEEKIDKNDYDIRDAVELLFDIIKSNELIPDNFESAVKSKTKLKNIDRLNERVK